MSELKFGDMVVMPVFKRAVFIFWGYSEDEDGDLEYVLTILRKAPPWETTIYAIGTTHRWSASMSPISKIDRWPS